METGSGGHSAFVEQVPHHHAPHTFLSHRTSSWVGAAPEFVRSRKEKGERSGVWNTAGLQGAEVDLVRGDEKSSK